MRKNIIFVEGGGDEEVDIVCRQAMQKLFERSGLKGRLPAVFPSGSRNQTFNDFKTAHEQAKGNFIALLVDSEDPVRDLEQPWEHLKARKEDNWDRPKNASDEQAFLMTTCMETWIVADREALRGYFNKAKDAKGDCPQEKALPAIVNLENRHRHGVQKALVHATRNCSNSYAKGKRSFEVLGRLNPDTLAQHLPSFARMIRILKQRL